MGEKTKRTLQATCNVDVFQSAPICTARAVINLASHDIGVLPLGFATNTSAQDVDECARKAPADGPAVMNANILSQHLAVSMPAVPPGLMMTPQRFRSLVDPGLDKLHATWRGTLPAMLHLITRHGFLARPPSWPMRPATAFRTAARYFSRVDHDRASLLPSRRASLVSHALEDQSLLTLTPAAHIPVLRSELGVLADEFLSRQASSGDETPEVPHQLKSSFVAFVLQSSAHHVRWLAVFLATILCFLYLPFHFHRIFSHPHLA